MKWQLQIETDEPEPTTVHVRASWETRDDSSVVPDATEYARRYMVPLRAGFRWRLCDDSSQFFVSNPERTDCGSFVDQEKMH